VNWREINRARQLPGVVNNENSRQLFMPRRITLYGAGSDASTLILLVDFCRISVFEQTNNIVSFHAVPLAARVGRMHGTLLAFEHNGLFSRQLKTMALFITSKISGAISIQTDYADAHKRRFQTALLAKRSITVAVSRWWRYELLVTLCRLTHWTLNNRFVVSPERTVWLYW